uniref:FERM domain-containing protein n=2 Tax=Anopheles albimanus TaxID=7167 RepID=A0A182FAA0_ANOAL
PQPICNLEELIRVVVTRDDDVSNTVTVFISPDRVINFAMEDRDASEFAIVLAGYYRLMAGKELPLEQEREVQIEDIAPPYLSQHTVMPNSWSYLPTEKQTHSIAFLMPPPYHSTGFRSATGSISSSSRSDEPCDRNANSARTSNRNGRPSLKEYDFDAAKELRVSRDGLERKIGGIPVVAVPEARNEEVLRRVAEMQKMVESSERYLNEHGDYAHHEFEVGKPGSGKLNFWRETSVDVDESDCESLTSSRQSSNEDSAGPGVLKHSDSLTLLTETINQGLDGIAKGLSSIYTAPFSEMNGKHPMPDPTGTGSAPNTPKSARKISGLSQILSELQALGNDLSQSESDSESLYTPNSSPIHRNATGGQSGAGHGPSSSSFTAGQQAPNGAALRSSKTIRTSFGLHSPDGGTGDGRDMNLKDYLRQLKEASSASELVGGGGGATDAATGTDLAAKKLAELYGYELLGDDALIETDPDIIDLRSLPPPQTPDELDNLGVLSVPPSGFDDGTGTAAKAENRAVASQKDPQQQQQQQPELATTAADGGDLEEFLKQVTIEPPTQKITPAVELTPEEILSYIIPPPPGLGDRGAATTEPTPIPNGSPAKQPAPSPLPKPSPPPPQTTTMPTMTNSSGSVHYNHTNSNNNNNNSNTAKNLNFASGPEGPPGPRPKPRTTLTHDGGTPLMVPNGQVAMLAARFAADQAAAARCYQVYYPPDMRPPNGGQQQGVGPVAGQPTTEYDLYSNGEVASAAATIAASVAGVSTEAEATTMTTANGSLPKAGSGGATANGHVIEYATVDRKGPFSCCAKSKSKEKEQMSNGTDSPVVGAEPEPSLALPPKPCPHAPPGAPQRPPKSAELQLRLASPVRSPPPVNGGARLNGAGAGSVSGSGSLSGNYYEMDPPSLPPRFEQSPPPSVLVTSLPPKKPPLPPVPLKPCIALRSPVPVLRNPHAVPGGGSAAVVIVPGIYNNSNNSNNSNHLQHLHHNQYHQHHHHHQPPVPLAQATQAPPSQPPAHLHHYHHHLHHHQQTSVSLSANSSPVRTAGIGSPHFHRNPACYREIERAFNRDELTGTSGQTNGTTSSSSTSSSSNSSGIPPASPGNGGLAYQQHHQRSHSDCPPTVCLKNAPVDSKPAALSLLSPQLTARKGSLPTAAIAPNTVTGMLPAAAGTVGPTFSNPGSPILSNRNGHVLNVDTLMAKTDVAMAGLLVKLDQVAAACSAAQTAGGGASIDEAKFQQARDELTDQSLHLVTASKHLVVSMSDANLTHLPEHLTACLSALRRITELAQDLTRFTSAPLQTRNIVLKVHDVASSFRELAGVRVGPAGAGQLALNAECLANVLATLLRSLRVFSP